MTAFYNERDPYAADWLRNLIAAGHIAPGVVSEEDIRDLRPIDLAFFTQCHFFAGIGVWSHALRRAGWADDRPVWTGSCPCQPFSAAGKQAGFADERHLWPVWHKLIGECRPPVVLGEQVASALEWVDLVSTDLEASGYAFGASDLCAAGFDGSHIRQRLYFVGLADASPEQHNRGGSAGPSRRAEHPDGGAVGGLADPDDTRLEGRDRVSERADQRAAGQGGVVGGLDHTTSARRSGPVAGAEGDPRDEARLRLSGEERGLGGVADADGGNPGTERQQPGWQHGQQPADGRDGAQRAHAAMLGRHAADWLFCRDGKWRPVEPGTFPLADAAPSRVGRLRAYGNALDAETASQFVAGVMDAMPMVEMLS